MSIKDTPFWKAKDLEQELVRATGRTTRLIDKYVQDLFNAKIGEWIIPKDHHMSRDRRVVEHLVRRLVSRMKTEHGIDIEVSRCEGWKVRLPIEVAERLAKFRADQYELYVNEMKKLYPDYKDI